MLQSLKLLCRNGALVLGAALTATAFAASPPPQEVAVWFQSADSSPNCRSDVAVGPPIKGDSWGPNSARKQAEEVCKQQAGGTGQCGVRSWAFRNRDGSENSVVVILRSKVPVFMGKCIRLTYGAGVGPTRELAEAAAIRELGNRNWDHSPKKHPVEVTSVVDFAQTRSGPHDAALESWEVSCGKAAGSTRALVERLEKGGGRLIRVRRGDVTATFTLEGLLRRAKHYDGSGTSQLVLGALGGEVVLIPAGVLGELVCGEPQTAEWNTRFLTWGKEHLKSLAPDACGPDGGAGCRPTVTSGGVRN